MAAPAGTKEVIVRFEGCRLAPYWDRGWSVGYGHSLSAHKEPIKRRYTQDEIDAFLERDIQEAVATCRTTIKYFDELPIPSQRVAILLAYQTGRGGFMRFVDFRRALSLRDYSKATNALTHSLWACKTQDSRVSWSIASLREAAHASNPATPALAIFFLPQ